MLFDVLHLVRVPPGFVQDPEDHAYNLKTRGWAAEKKGLVTLIAALIGAVQVEPLWPGIVLGADTT